MAMRRLQLRIKGFVEPRRCFCSEPPPPPSSSSNKDSKEITAAKEESAVDSKSFIKRFMPSHPVVSSKVTEVREKVGESRYMLKNILTEMKSKVLPTSQINKQVVVEATVMEGNRDNEELDGPEKESVPLTGMLNVEKSHTTGIKDPRNLSLDKISDNAELPKPKQMEHAMEMLHVEKPLNTEAKGTKDLLLTNICDNTELTECKQVEQSAAMLDMGESHRGVKGSGDLYPVKISDNAELPEPKQTELSMEALALSTTGLGQQLSNISQSTRYVVKEEESTRAPFSDVHSSDLNLTKTNSYEREETDFPSAKENFPGAETSASEKEGIYLFDFCNSEINKGKKLTRPKIDALKHETSELKDNSHVISLVDIFKKNRKISGDKLINEKKLERDGTLNMQEPETQGLINRIFEVSTKAEKSGSLDEIFKLPSLNKEQSWGGHRDKAKVWKAEVQKIRSNKLHGANSSNLAANKDRGEEKQSCKNEVGNRNSKLSKNEKAMDSIKESDSDVEASDYPEPEPSDLIHLISKRLNSDATPNDQMSGFEHCLLVKFMCKTTKVNDLSVAFGDCGPISDIHIVNSRSENRFNYAYICFKTAEGLKGAANKQDVAICSTDVVFEPASSLKAYNKVFNAESIGDLDFSIAFLKNPPRSG